MADRNSSGLAGPAVLITLLAALGIGGSIRHSATPASALPPIGSALPSAPAESVGLAGSYEKNGGDEHGAGYLLQRFFSRLDDGVEDKKAWATRKPPDPAKKQPDPFSADFDYKDPRRNYSIRFLIATLPAPISPPPQYQFDTELAALRSAVAAIDYSLDSFDLPWTGGGKDSAGKFQLAGEIDIDPAESPSPTPSPTPSGTKSTDQSAKAKLKRSQDEIDKNSKTSYTLKPNSEGENRWKRDAGVIVFKHGTQLLIVFLVGETPTLGINRMAMLDALDQIAWLEGWKVPPEGRGPPPDLVERFKTATSPPFPKDEIRIVGPAFSGSAASLRNILEEFRHSSINWRPDASIQIISGTATSVDQELTDTDTVRRPSISFRTVQIPDRVLWGQIPRILDNVADLTAVSRSGDSSQRIALLLEEDTIYGSHLAENHLPNLKNVLQMKFPLHISQLRSAKGNSDTIGVGPDLERHDPALPDEAGQQRRDVIQQFSPRAAVYDELHLSNLLVTIKREHIRYVGIAATDVEDLIFLVQQIRIYCPDTVVFTTSADIAFLHSDVNADLRGMLVFTTYPLFNQLQKWTFPFDGDAGRETFLNDLAHGVYNATLAQLYRPDKMLDYGQPFVAYPHSPVIQIGVVGRDDIWPLGFQLPMLDGSDAVLPPNSGSRRRGADCEAYLPVGGMGASRSDRKCLSTHFRIPLPRSEHRVFSWCVDLVSRRSLPMAGLVGTDLWEQELPPQTPTGATGQRTMVAELPAAYGFKRLPLP